LTGSGCFCQRIIYDYQYSIKEVKIMKELQLWGKIGIIFFSIHLIISLILFNFYYQGEANLSSLFAIFVDFPIFLLGIKFFPKLFENIQFYKIFFPIVGSILYGIIGILVGLIIQKNKNRRIDISKQ